MNHHNAKILIKNLTTNSDSSVDSGALLSVSCSALSSFEDLFGMGNTKPLSEVPWMHSQRSFYTTSQNVTTLSTER